MSEPVLVAGVDAGGTRSVALVGGLDGTPRGRGEGGPGNPRAVGFLEAVEAIRQAVATAQRQAGREDGPLDRVVVGAAGVGRPPDRDRLRQDLAAALGLPVERLEVLTDLRLLLPAAGLDHGVALVAGTGSSALGVAPHGRVLQAGGWGYLWGDEGSAFDVGRRALRAAARADDGTGPPTALVERLADALGVPVLRDAIPALYRAPDPRRAIAALAPVVVATAVAGDQVADRVLARAAHELAHLALTAAARLDLLPGAAVVASGGLLRAGPLLLDRLAAALARGGAGELRLLDREPAEGALRLAAAAAAAAGSR